MKDGQLQRSAFGRLRFCPILLLRPRRSAALLSTPRSTQKDADVNREKLAQRLEAIRNRRRQAYADRLDRKLRLLSMANEPNGNDFACVCQPA